MFISVEYLPRISVSYYQRICLSLLIYNEIESHIVGNTLLKLENLYCMINTPHGTS